PPGSGPWRRANRRRPAGSGTRSGRGPRRRTPDRTARRARRGEAELLGEGPEACTSARRRLSTPRAHRPARRSERVPAPRASSAIGPQGSMPQWPLGERQVPSPQQKAARHVMLQVPPAHTPQSNPPQTVPSGTGVATQAPALLQADVEHSVFVPHEVPAGFWSYSHAPVASLQAPSRSQHWVLRGLPQVFSVPPQAPAPSHTSFSVHRIPSSHEAPELFGAYAHLPSSPQVPCSSWHCPGGDVQVADVTQDSPSPKDIQLPASQAKPAGHGVPSPHWQAPSTHWSAAIREQALHAPPPSPHAPNASSMHAFS